MYSLKWLQLVVLLWVLMICIWRGRKELLVLYDVTSSGLITFKSQKFNIKSDDKGQITTVKGKADSLSLRPK